MECFDTLLYFNFPFRLLSCARTSCATTSSVVLLSSVATLDQTSCFQLRLETALSSFPTSILILLARPTEVTSLLPPCNLHASYQTALSTWCCPCRLHSHPRQTTSLPLSLLGNTHPTVNVLALFSATCIFSNLFHMA